MAKKNTTKDSLEHNDGRDEMNLPDKLPILPIRNTVIYPYRIMPLMVSRGKSVKAIDSALDEDKLIGFVAQREAELDDPSPTDLYNYGTVGKILKMLKFPDGSISIFVEGIKRLKVLEYEQRKPFLIARIETVEEHVEESVELEAFARNAASQFEKMVSFVPNLSDELRATMTDIEEPGRLADFIASNLNLKVPEKQEILETLDVKARLEKITQLLNREIELLELGVKIQSQVQSEMETTQREFYLRKQMDAIKKELGEEDERALEIKELKEKIEAARMPEEAKKSAERELDRVKMMPPGAAEYTVSRTYLDWLVNLPWSVSTEDNLDVLEAQRVLDEDHYGLEKIKDRVLEYLAVRKLKGDMKGPIICFVGPPGVGKTSLGKSIARALGRKFARISLGGVRDEAEIRGHRRTYIGSLPGRIIQGLRKAESNNPVFMLDEVDKIGLDYRGDPASALLEVLDPEQNFSFSDHYLEVPFDLSKVMFITTANVLDTVPGPLQDRMEVLRLPGYIEEEKVQIAKKYLIPRQTNEHGLTDEYIAFEDSAIRKIISDYTREAGLRNLEREIANICRKVAKEVVSGNKEKKAITSDMVHEFLGPPKFYQEVAERIDRPGIATGLAWTPAGGDILFIESSSMKGNRALTLTGQLGDVMKESAQAALSYLRSHADELNVDEEFFTNNDIHLHVPAGAIPKDGPSAGVTIVSSLASLVTGRVIRDDIAMTGEITLSGKVLPIGGVKEKVLAAHRAGIKTVVLPGKNRKDLEDIPEGVRKKLNFRFVENISEVLDLALKEAKKKTYTSKTSKKELVEAIT